MNRLNFDRVSAGRAKTLSLVRDLTQEELDYRPDKQRWSPGEILDHLLRADATYTNQLKRLMDLARSGSQPSIFVSLSQMDYTLPLIPRTFLPFMDVPVGMLNVFIPSALREGLLRNRIFAVSAPEALQPTRGRPGPELRRDLVESLGRIEALFCDNSDVNFSTFRYYHPLFGYNRAEDILSLLASHEHRHQQQLTEALRDLPARNQGRAA